MSWLLFFISLFLVSCGGKDVRMGETERKVMVVPNSYILGLWDQESMSKGLLQRDKSLFSFARIEQIGEASAFGVHDRRNDSFFSQPPPENNGSLALFRVDLHQDVDSQAFLDKLDHKVVAIWEPNRLNHLFSKKKIAVGSPNIVKNLQAPYLKNNNFFEGFYERYEEVGGYWWLDAIRMGEVYQALGQRDLDALPDDKLAALAPVIAILDSGIDYQHPALSGKIWINPTPGLAGCENDEYGCDTTASSRFPLGKGPAIPFGTKAVGESCPVETVQGQTFLNGACIHGTHVAGLIVANDEYGVAGVCPQCKVLSIKVVENIDGEGKVPDSAILKGLKYVQNINKMHGGIVKLVNSSFGKFEQSLSVSLVVKELMATGVVVVGASGNENTTERVFPAALDEVIAVTALSREGKKASYSNFGTWISLSAPGGDVEFGSRSDEAIVSTVPGGDIYLSQGTSVATPLVTGVAGLIQMLEPDLQGWLLRQRLLGSADRKLYDIDFAGGYNNSYGPKHGLESVPGLLGRGMLDGNAAYLGELTQEDELTPSERVPPQCGEIIMKKRGDAPSLLVLIFFYLMPIILLGVRRGEVP